MHKRIKKIIENLKGIFLSEVIEKIARKTKFVQRKSKLTAEKFISLCVFNGEDLCTETLSNLSARLGASEGILISSQALNDRFNEFSVEFMKEVFTEILKIQNKILRQQESIIKTHFKRIKIVDSTSLILPEIFKEKYKGSGGSSSDSSVKIQLEYDLLTGEFFNCDILDGIRNDADYLPNIQQDIREKDLYLKDLGYFKIDDLATIDKQNAFYISKLKSTIGIYSKNPNPEFKRNGEVKKSTEYTRVDIEKLVEPLAEGETIELFNIYIGKDKKLKSRLIISKLTEENKRKKVNKHKKNIKKGKTKNTSKTEFWNSVNVYITNIPSELLTKELIHNIYSLRWSIELMFKVWKSLFRINDIKKVKIERFQCFLYGRLISLLLSSSLVFSAKKIVYDEFKKELSEIKAFGTIKEFLPEIRKKIFKGEFVLSKLLETIFKTHLKCDIKSKRKGRKTTILILESIKVTENEFLKLAS